MTSEKCDVYISIIFVNGVKDSKRYRLRHEVV